jgi:predicted XRE-type DNA-binding protein
VQSTNTVFVSTDVALSPFEVSRPSRATFTEVGNTYEDAEEGAAPSVFERQKLGVHVQPYKDEVTLWNKVQ